MIINNHSYLWKVIKSVFFSFPLLLIFFLVQLNPSGQGPLATFREFLPALVFLLLFSLLFSILFLLILHFKDFPIALIFLIIICMMTFYILLALLFHRDYFTAVFQSVMILIILLYEKLAEKDPSANSKKILFLFFIFGMIALSAIFLWLILMGYSISVREEPRWIESIFYNIYNFILAILFLIKLLEIYNLQKRKISISEESFWVDNFDFSQCLGDQGMRLFKMFLESPKFLLFCKDINQDSMNTKDDYPCQICSKEVKVSQCSRYRSTYNSIRDIKILLEALDIGTILFPSHKREVLSQGWKLKLNKNTILDFDFNRDLKKP